MAQPVLNQNQFTQSPVLGMLTYDPQPATLPAQINPSTTATAGTITAGCAVKLVAVAGSQMIVDVTTSASDGPVVGVIEYTKQKNVYVGGDQINVACEGNVLHLWTSAAVNRGDRVSVTNPSTTVNPPTVATDTTSGDFTLGFALTQASAANQFIRIMVRPGKGGAGSITTVSP